MRPRAKRILDYRKYPILYVDDEKQNLRIFELAFGRDFSIVTADNAASALAVINRTPVAIVLSDQRMPGMAGTEFLARVASIDPKTIRILVTAYGDVGTLENAINSGSIYRFIPKPWVPEEVRLTIKRGIEVYALDQEKEQLVRELTLLNGVSKTINQELQMDALLDLLAVTITRDFGFDAAAVLIQEKTSGRLRLMKSDSGSSATIEELRRIDLSERTAPSFIGALHEGYTEILKAEDVSTMDPAVRRWVTEVAASETLVVPLCGRRGLEGALVVDNRRGGPSFSVDDQNLLEGLANQAVVAIENARLVDDLRRSREQVMRSERLGTLGTLAAGLAHEINNPLVSIRTFMTMAPEKRGEDDDRFWGEYHSLACDEVERIRRLVERMQRLGRGDVASVFEVLDLAEIAGQVITLAQGEASAKDLVIRREFDDDLEKFIGVKDQIHQLLLNLLLNAIYAARNEGTVSVRLKSWERGDFVSIEVTDDGDGISETDLERIFDPFFTTKGPDEGTGLGLMICHRIALEHGGRIEVTSRQGEGATFRVFFPHRRVLEE